MAEAYKASSGEEDAPTATTVRDVRVVGERTPRDPWDYTVDYVVTPYWDHESGRDLPGHTMGATTGR